MARIYEDEESKNHIKEQQEKALRDHAREKANQVKQEYRELNKEIDSENKIKENEAKVDAQGFKVKN